MLKNKNEAVQSNKTGNPTIINLNEEIASDDEYLDWKDENVSYIELKNNSVTGTGVAITGTTIKIINAGNYHISGTLDNGTIIIDTEGVVRLILDNANINSNNTSAINVKNAKKVIISLEEGTNNSVSDTGNYVYDDEVANEPDGTIFSKDDLIINGLGILNVTGNFKDGIVSKDILKIMSGTINITAVGDGIRGKDCVIIKSGNIAINSENDGIKSTNDTDITLGYIVIDGGTFNINVKQDGFQAETSLIINNGSFDITTNNGISTAKVVNNFGGMESSSQLTDEISRKALKAKTGIQIIAGEFKINSADDSIHSNRDITIQNGTFEVSSGDDRNTFR